MQKNKIKHMLHLKDYSSKDIKEILDLAIKIKKNPQNYETALKNQTLIMYFEKNSTRTRISFETAMTQLGGHAIFLDKKTSQVSIAELKDEIRAIERYADFIMSRPLKHETLIEMTQMVNVPVINGCCEMHHPCQALADALTMIEHKGDLKGKKIVWLGIANNVSNSLIEVCTKLGAQITLCVPEKDSDSYDKELEDAAKNTKLYIETTDLSCLKDADFVHTDTWINMEFMNDPKFAKEKERRLKVFKPYQLNAAILEKYKSKAKIMHCMPCHVNYEITRDAIDHKNSIIFDQAENRLHVEKAVLVWLNSKK
ncbi:MAG: ornithine carbamoyltransferase [Candidatus Woesearchaeota archaeon]